MGKKLAQWLDCWNIRNTDKCLKQMFLNLKKPVCTDKYFKLVF
jgi:hypothetical protein